MSTHFLLLLYTHRSTVPLATLVSGTKPPTTKEAAGAILSPDGFKRYFVVHGGLFSQDQVTLDDVRKIQRVGRQPGTEGLMCMLFPFLLFPLLADRRSQARYLSNEIYLYSILTSLN